MNTQYIYQNILLCSLSFLMIIGVLAGCQDKVQPATYAKWVENQENGLQQTKTVEDYIFSLQYKPIEYMVALQERTPQLHTTVLQREKQKMEGLQYFNFKLSTLSLRCRMFHFEGANGILPYDNCVLAFDKNKNPKTDKTFLYRAEKLGLGWINMTIKAEDIQRIPQLKTI